jgi:hypothetical protein
MTFSLDSDMAAPDRRVDRPGAPCYLASVAMRRRGKDRTSMTADRMTAVLLAVLLAASGCAAATGGDGGTARSAPAPPAMVEPAQIFADVPQGP